VWGKTVLQAPALITACPFSKMTGLRFNDTGITPWKLFETGVAKALIETFVGLSSTRETVDLTDVFKTNGLAYEVIH
jgi:hypothetical protein